MRPTELRRILDATLADGRLTRTETRALRAVLDDWRPSVEALARLRSDIFDAARAGLDSRSPTEILDWLEAVLKVTLPTADEAPSEALARTHFSPGEACRDQIVTLFEEARRQVDVCVFTVTDDRVAKAILRAHRRGVQVRIVTDDLKAEDRGSDVDRLAEAGVPVRTDQTDAHMHHKFAVFDEATLLTGSYNWTRSAFLENHENILVTGDPRFVGPFLQTFEALWSGPDTGPHRASG